MNLLPLGEQRFKAGKREDKKKKKVKKISKKKS
jgi:hypothetical protein